MQGDAQAAPLTMPVISPPLALVRPLPLFAVAVMAVNDVWGKPTFHNFITGKLSDLATCFVLPLYLAALLTLVLRGRAPRTVLLVGCVVTVGLFATLELSPAAAATFCEANQVMGAWFGIHRPYRLTADVTDLAALALVPLAYLYGRKLAAG
jgi:hypothetical protein